MSDGKTPAWANPAPAGLTAYAIACFTFYAVLTGRVPHSTVPMLGCWLLGGFIVQIVVALIELREGALLGGNVFLVFSGFFMLTGGLEFLLKGFGINATSEIDGWAWLVLLLTLVLWTPAYLKTSPRVMGILVLVLDVGVLFVTLRDLGAVSGATGSPIAGYALGISGILAIYLAAAMQLNAAFGKTLLPLGKPIL